jgi:eukaryotic-like serine/threonine-protein kinase
MPNPSRSSLLVGSTFSPENDSEVVRALDAYLSGIEAGQPADPEKLLADHPALAAQLRAYLGVMNLAGRLVQDGTSGPEIAAGRAQRTDRRLGSSVLSNLEFGSSPLPEIHLHEPVDEGEPLVMPRLAELPGHGVSSLGRYQLQGEIARGGMGAILRGRDVDLGRELAIKVLLESHRGDPNAMRRFVEEAQIGGQLQHPGVVPVYELGAFPDRRPYFAMKLVRGRTLAALLHERSSLAHDLPRFLSIFEQICQTMAYAHARRVIHRDLKPSNVMVGSFGEVQVMDWGLAKVLPSGGVVDDAVIHPNNEAMITTVRTESGRSGAKSQAGSVLGTPSYMAPEQARGEVDQIDERTDVFGLGAILFEVLTGKPPYVGASREELREMAARGDLSGANERLTHSTADGALIEIARDCLAKDRDARPRNAGEVTQRLTAYTTGVQERLHAAELARVEAQARAAEERRRRRLAVALAASVLITAGLTTGGWAHLSQQRQQRAAVFNQAFGEAEGLFGEAQRVIDDMALWQRAREAARAAARLLVDAPDEVSRARVTALAREVDKAAKSAESERRLLDRLAGTGLVRADDPEGLTADAEYGDAFRAAGIDLDSLPVDQAAVIIRARSHAACVSLSASLDHWAFVRRNLARNQDGARRLSDVARLADPDPWRDRLRELMASSSRPKQINDLTDLAFSARMDDLPAVSLELLGLAFLGLNDPPGALEVFRKSQRLFPADLRINLSLAQCLWRLGRKEEAIRYYSAATALRPEASHELAHLLAQTGETDLAIEVLQDLMRLRPKQRKNAVCLARILQARGRTNEASALLREAIPQIRAARRQNDDVSTRLLLVDALFLSNQRDLAITECRDAIRLKPDRADFHKALGTYLTEERRLNEAIAELREAIRLKPGWAEAHRMLGTALAFQGRPEDAITELREAILIDPHEPASHYNLGNLLGMQGKLGDAVAEYRETLRIKPDYVEAHNNLGSALRRQGKLDAAMAEFREAIRFKPDLVEAHCNLGSALTAQGKLDAAISEYREALRIKPDYAEAHCNLGNALREQGKLDAAMAEFREAIRFKPDLVEAHFNLGSALKEQGKLDAAMAELREAVRLKPGDANVHANLGDVLSRVGKLDEAIAECREALLLSPNDSAVHNELGIALVAQGTVDAAITEFREALRLKRDDVKVRCNLAHALKAQGKLNAAISEFREALRINPEDALTHCNLGGLLGQQGHFAESLVELKRGHELGSKDPQWRYPSADWVRAAERLVELELKLPELLSGHDKPRNAEDSLVLAQMCYNKKLHGGAARFCADAFVDRPNLAEDMNAQTRYNAACAAALAGSGQSKDDPPLDEKTRLRWRKQAVEWLKADLAAWTKFVATGNAQAKPIVTKTLEHWKADTDLTALRDAASLTKLPADEQKACRGLWAEVDALLAMAQAPTKNQ